MTSRAFDALWANSFPRRAAEVRRFFTTRELAADHDTVVALLPARRVRPHRSDKHVTVPLKVDLKTFHLQALCLWFGSTGPPDADPAGPLLRNSCRKSTLTAASTHFITVVTLVSTLDWSVSARFAARWAGTQGTAAGSTSPFHLDFQACRRWPAGIG